MSLALTINGVSRAFDAQNMNVRKKLANRTTCEFNMMGSSSIRPVVGHPVSVTDGGSAIFGGTIDEINEVKFGGNTDLTYQIRCVDHTAALDKRTTGNLMVFGRIPVTVNTGTDVFTSAQPDHYLLNGDFVMFTSSGTLPGGIASNTVYYVVNKTADTFQVSASSGGSAINITSAGSGEILVHFTTGTVVKRIGLVEGITAGSISPGNRVDTVTFTYTRRTDAISQVTPADYIWWVDALAQLHYVPRNTVSAPFNITNASPIGSVSVRFTREQYFNSVVVQAQEGPNFRTKNFTGDGTTKRWYLGDFDAVDKPSAIVVNGVEKTLGEYGDTGKDFYYTPLDRWLYQDSGASAVPASQPIAFSFYCVNFRTQNASDATEISNRASIEGGTGEYEYITEESSMSADAALDLANHILDTHKTISKSVSYETRSSGMDVGQIQNINLPEHGINEDFLVDEVHVGVRNNVVWYYITAVSGVRLLGWVGLFLKFLEGGGGGGGSAVATGGGGSSAIAGIYRYPVSINSNSTITYAIKTPPALLVVEVTIDTTGGYTVGWDTMFADSPSVFTLPNKKNYVLWESDGTNWNQVAPLMVR